MSEEGAQADVASYRRYTAKDLHYRFELEDLVKAEENFNIISVYKHNFAIVDIIPRMTGRDQIFWILEDCYECAEEFDGSVNFVPQEMDVVLAKGKEDSRRKHYQRAIVHSIHVDKQWATVVWIDIGGSEVVEVSSLKPVNSDVMKHPRVAYAVILDGANQTSNLILLDDFLDAMSPVMQRDFTVLLTDPTGTKGSLLCKRKAKLTFNRRKELIDFNDVIQGLEIWQWERETKLRGTDEEIVARPPSLVELRNFRKCPIPVESGRSFTATISVVLDNDVAGCTLAAKLLSHEKYVNLVNVLHNQIQRYAENITGPDFYPAIDDFLLIKFPDSPFFKERVTVTGKWIRAFRTSVDMIWCFDFNDYVPYPLHEEISCRRIPKDFIGYPALGMSLCPVDASGKPIPYDDMKKDIIDGKRYEFLVAATNLKDGDPQDCLVNVRVLKQVENVEISDYLKIKL